MKRKKFPTKWSTYEVTLRRDVQQVARVRVTAASRQDAIDTAESVCGNWNIEQLIGAHRPEVRREKRR